MICALSVSDSTPSDKATIPALTEIYMKVSLVITRSVVALKTFLIALLCTVFIVACSSRTTLGTRSLTEILPESVIPGFPIQIPLSGSIDVPLTAEAQSLADETEFVTFARVRSLTFTIVDSSESDANEDGAMDNFDFLSAMQIFLSAELNGEPSEILVASLPEGDPQIGTGVREIAFTVEDVDVLDYIEAPGGYQLRVQGSGFVPPDNVVFNGDLRYRVGVGIRTDR